MGLGRVKTSAQGPKRRYWPWPPNVGFSPTADASLRSSELRVWARRRHRSDIGLPPSAQAGKYGNFRQRRDLRPAIFAEPLKSVALAPSNAIAQILVTSGDR